MRPRSGDGAATRSIPLDDLERIQRWMIDLASPAFPGAIDKALVARGKGVFSQ